MSTSEKIRTAPSVTGILCTPSLYIDVVDIDVVSDLRSSIASIIGPEVIMIQMVPRPDAPVMWMSRDSILHERTIFG